MIFSVVVPTYNRRLTLIKVLDQLQRQNFPADEYEVIVVDDGSTDGTRDYLQSLSWFQPRLVVLFQENRGPATARNLGIRRARGELIAFTDDDCLVAEDWLNQLQQGYRLFPQCAGVGGYLEAPEAALRTNLIAQLESFETHIIYKAGRGSYVGGFESPAGGTNNISYRKKILEEVGLFDENFPVPAGEDADLKKRIVERGYLIAYWPIKVTHLDPYSFHSFVRRSLAHGIGSSFFEKKHGRKPKFGTLVSQAVSLPKVFLRVYLQSGRFPLAFIFTFKETLMLLGQLQYLLTSPEAK